MEPDFLERLRRNPQPPPHLESRVVAAVSAAGHIADRPRRQQPWLVAAAILLLASGVVIGRQWPGGQPSRTPTSSFMLLLGGTVTPTADGSSRAAEYGAWARDVASRGVPVRGAEIADGGRVVGPVAGESGALLALDGYFIVDVATEAEAVALAETCPHTKYGGSVVVRPLAGG